MEARKGVEQIKVLDHTLELEGDWGIGIGGKIWTNGRLLVDYFQRHRDKFDKLFKGKRILELGSGTGLVGLATAVFEPEEVILSDLESHLGILDRNAERNRKLHALTDITVQELAWGEDTSHIKLPIDYIVGTDIAYLSTLYEPLLKTLKAVCSSHTMVFLGMNRLDTQPRFFQRLEDEGFQYHKIGDEEINDEYRGKDYALIVITRCKAMEYPEPPATIAF